MAEDRPNVPLWLQCFICLCVAAIHSTPRGALISHTESAVISVRASLLSMGLSNKNRK